MADQPTEDKWPWTVSSREYGRLEAKVDQLEHRARGDRQVIELLAEQANEIEAALNKLKSRIWAGLAALGVFSGFMAWIVDTAISINK